MSDRNSSAAVAARAPEQPANVNQLARNPQAREAAKPIRIAMVVYRDDLNVGGSLRVVEILAHALDPARAEAHIVFAYGGPGPITKRAKVACHFLESKGPLDLRGWLRARQQMRTISPDVVHFHNPAYWLHGAMAGMGYKKLIHLHGPYFPNRMGRADRFLMHRTHQLADASVCITRDMRQMVLKQGWGTPEQTWTVYNSIDCNAALGAPSHSEARSQLGLPRGGKVIGVVCRLAWYKGCADAVRVLERLPSDWSLLFCGDGPMKAYLMDLASQAGLAERTFFAGMVDDMSIAYASMDAFLFLSKLEPFGLVIAEAMAARVPVFGLAAEGAYRDSLYPLITPDNSIFVERSSPGDYLSPEPSAVIQAIANRITEFGEHPDHFADMVDRAEHWVRERFDGHVQAEAMLEVYDFVLGRPTDNPK